MESQVTDIGENQKKLEVSLSEADFLVEIDAILKEMVKTAEFPGFRKGKVPIQHLRAQLGEEQVRKDALGSSLPKYLQEAIDGEKLDPIAVRDVEVVSGMEDGNVVFKAKVEIRPELALQGYENLKITLPPLLPTEEELKEIQTNYLKSFGELEDVARNAMKGDHITIDLHSAYNGADVEGMNVSDFVYELGSTSLIAELEKELTGAKLGDILEFNSQHPSQEGQMRIKVLVKKIQENKLPELTDELALKVSEFETADELKEDINTQITESKRQHLLRLAQDKLLEGLIDLVSGAIPQALIEKEVEAIKSRLPQEQHAQLEVQIKEQAVKSAKVDLGIRAIIRQEKIEVEDSEVKKAADLVQAQISQMPEKQLNLKPNLDTIKTNLLQEKAMEWLLKNAHITDENSQEIVIEDLIIEPKIEEKTEDNQDDDQ